jgi:integrase
MGKKFRGVRKASATTIEIDFKCKGQRNKREPSDANLKKLSKFMEPVLYAIENNTFDYAVTFPDGKKGHKFYLDSDCSTIKAYLTEWLANKKPLLKAST